MSSILEVDERGNLQLPADVLPISKPHTRYVASTNGYQVVLAPADSEKPFLDDGHFHLTSGRHSSLGGQSYGWAEFARRGNASRRHLRVDGQLSRRYEHSASVG
jgi:hypothetical protein